jgi:hypothetical protein
MEIPDDKCTQLLYILDQRSGKNKLFLMMPDSRINSRKSSFIFNLQKINTNQYYESDFLNAGIIT